MDKVAIDAVLEAAVAAGHVPNVVAVATDRTGVVYAGSAGTRAANDAASGPVGPDTMYRLASMTKPIVTAAALQQVERGLLNLEAPVAEYLPEFGELQVLTGFSGNTPLLRPPARPATVQDLICHTSGLAYDFFSADQQRWQEVTGTPSLFNGNRAIFASPLMFDPGERWAYGINTDWLGRVVEATSGLGLDKYLEVNLTGPLAMESATFQLTAAQRAAAVPVHMAPSGSWEATPVDLPEAPDWWAGGHGLSCTPNDYLRFLRMILNDGTLDGVSVLSPGSVAGAFRDQIAPLTFPAEIPAADRNLVCDFNLGPGWSWGHGLLLNTFDLPGMRAAFSGGWAGIFNTHFWVDRTNGVAGALFTQCLPFGTPEILGLCAQFEMGVYA
ncbi:MAG TPA: serine hydrolase domain-containing protein [Sporichthyaceae bacterium]|jgi:CubicO group peptidase (beta-lactamase class C family)|nr:serine hydrolase domain-containing protein [Sporichthyaceae bacterium]